MSGMSGLHHELEKYRREAYYQALSEGKSEAEAREIGDRVHAEHSRAVFSGSMKMVAWGATGAALGSVVPVVGTTIGAIVGGIAGLLSGVSDPRPLSDAKDTAETVKKHFFD